MNPPFFMTIHHKRLHESAKEVICQVPPRPKSDLISDLQTSNIVGKKVNVNPNTVLQQSIQSAQSIFILYRFRTSHSMHKQ